MVPPGWGLGARGTGQPTRTRHVPLAVVTVRCIIEKMANYLSDLFEKLLPNEKYVPKVSFLF